MTSKSRIKLRLCGQRMKWTFIRLVIFITTLALFAMDPIISSLLFAAVAGGILLVSKDRLRTDRENQLTRELVDARPDASAEQLRREYSALFRMEIRRDALLYLFFALYAALWFLLMRGLEISELSVFLGLLVVTPALLITALVLLIRSLLPRTGTAPVSALEDYIQERTNQRERSERLARPDLRRQGGVICTEEKDEAPTLPLICASLQPYVRGNGVSALLIFGRILILVTVLGWVLMGLSMGSGYLLAALAFLSYYILAIVFLKTLKKDGGSITSSAIPGRTFRRLTKSGVLVRDRAISIIPSIQNATILEICFDKTGTLLCHCSIQDYLNIREYRDREAYLLRDDKRFYGLCFLKEDSAAQAPETAPMPEASAVPAPMKKDPARPRLGQAPSKEIPPLEEDLAQAVREGSFLSDEQMQEAARRRLEHLDPSQQDAWEDALNEEYALMESKSWVNGTSAERERASMLLSESLSMASGPYAYSDLIRMDDSLREEGVSREEILTKKSISVPFRAFLPLILAAAAVIVGTPIIALIQRNTGAELGFLYVLLSAASGIVAMRFAGTLLNARKVKKDFKKLQKAYSDPLFWSSRIEIQKYMLFRDQFKAAREAAKKNPAGESPEA